MRAWKIIISMTAMMCVLSVANAKYYGEQLCHQQGFHCIKVKSGQSWESLFPDLRDRGIVMRINRMNIRLWAGIILAVPDNLQSVDIMDFAPFPKQIQSRGEKIVAVDPAHKAWGAFDADGRLLRWGPASAGQDWCNDTGKPCRTKTGKFRVYTAGSSDCFSSKFPLPDGGAPMPYCMYFNGGEALHGEPNGLPGYNASHGCVRMYVSDAEWLRYNFIDPPDAANGYKGTQVIVGQYAKPNEHLDDDDSEDS